MGPPKFDDISKPATEILKDDFQVKGNQIKTKFKTNFEGLNDFVRIADGGKKEGAVLSQTIDLSIGDNWAIGAPTKLSFKLPKPFGVPGLAFPKLELDKKHEGKISFEGEFDLAKHGVDGVVIQSTYKGAALAPSLAGSTLGVHYTGMKGVALKAEFNCAEPTKYKAEATVNPFENAAMGFASTGGKADDSPLDVALSYNFAPAFCSMCIQESFKAYSFHGRYKAPNDVDVAAQYTMGAKKGNGWAAALAFKGLKEGMLLKAKLAGDDFSGQGLSASFGLKYDLAKGIKVVVGAGVPIGGGEMTKGFQLSIE